MKCSLLLAAAVMLATTATSWADSTEGVPNVKNPDQENVQAQMRDTWEEIKNYSVEQKDQALAAIRDAMAELDVDIEQAQKEIEEGWGNLSSDARLEKQEALGNLKDEREEMDQQYEEMEDASRDNWEEAKYRFGNAWDAAKREWNALISDDDAS